MILDELLVALGFDYDPKEAKQFKDDIAKTTNIVKGLVQAAAAGAAAITGMTIASTRASDEQGKLANEIGETVENISALQFAQQRAGGAEGGARPGFHQTGLQGALRLRGLRPLSGREIPLCRGVRPAAGEGFLCGERFLALDRPLHQVTGASGNGRAFPRARQPERPQ